MCVCVGGEPDGCTRKKSQATSSKIIITQQGENFYCPSGRRFKPQPLRGEFGRGRGAGLGGVGVGDYDTDRG